MGIVEDTELTHIVYFYCSYLVVAAVDEIRVTFVRIYGSRRIFYCGNIDGLCLGDSLVHNTYGFIGICGDLLIIIIIEEIRQLITLLL